MNNQEKIMSALAQGYQLLSKAMKQKPSKEGFQQVLQMLGDDGIQACVEVVEQGPEVIAQTMAEIIQQKQTQKAEKGAKLNRLIALNNSCPEGYLKKGGKCKKCEKGQKLDPSQGAFHVSAYFQKGTNRGGISAADKFKKAKEYNYKGVHMKHDAMTPGVMEVIPGGIDVIGNAGDRYWKERVQLSPEYSPYDIPPVTYEDLIIDPYNEFGWEYDYGDTPIVAGRRIYENVNGKDKVFYLGRNNYINGTSPEFVPGTKEQYRAAEQEYKRTRGPRTHVRTSIPR